MSITYLDTSALIKRYIREQGSEALSAHWPSFSIVGSAVIIYVEIAAALAKAERLGWLDAEVAQNTWGAFLNDWGKLSLININKAVLNRASDLAWKYGLRGYDAVHLGAALVWQEGLRDMVQLCTFDRQLWSAAKQVSMSVWPDELDPFLE